MGCEVRAFTPQYLFNCGLTRRTMLFISSETILSVAPLQRLDPPSCSTLEQDLDINILTVRRTS